VAHAISSLPAALATLPGAQPGANYTQPLTTIAQYLYNVAQDLNVIDNWLTAIAPSIHASATATANLSQLPGILTALVNIHASLQALNAEGPNYVAELDCICKALQAIAASTKPVDLTQVVKQLSDLVADDQVPEAWIEALISTGAVPPDMVQLIQGTTWQQVMATALNYLGWLFGLGAAEIATEVQRLMQHVVLPLAAGMWQLLGTTVAGAAEGMAPVLPGLTQAAHNLVVTVDAGITAIFGFAVNTVIQAYEADVGPIDVTTLAGVAQVQQLLLARCLEMGMSAHFLATLPELAYFTKSLGLNQTAAFVAELAGFREVLINTHRPFLVAKLGRPATYAYNREFPTTLPALQAAQTWYARRMVALPTSENLWASAGFAPAWYPALTASSYRPVSARAIATLLQDQPIDVAGLTRILQDNSYSDADVTFMLGAYEYASLKNVRNSYVSELVSAYQHGVVADAELTDSLADLGWSNDAINFVLQRCALARRVTLAQKVQEQVVPLVAQGSITPEEGSQQLEAAGIQPWYADLEITLATTKAEIHAAKLEAAAEAKAARETQRNLTRAAIANFQAGTIDAAGLTAALVALGLVPSLITSIVTVQTDLQTGKMKRVFGQLVNPNAARVLTERVAAVEAQLKAQLIPEAVAQAQLVALGLKNNDVNALIARWSAEKPKTLGPDVLVPVQTG